MMKTNCFKNHIVKTLAVAALCGFAAFAQSDDWNGQPAAEPAAAPAVAPVVAQPAEEAAQPPVADEQPAKPAGIIDRESSQRLGTELSTRALAAAPYLRANSSAEALGVGKVQKPKKQLTYHQFDRVTVKPAGAEFPFKVGDTVDVMNGKGQRVSHDGKSARVVVRVGRGVVLGYAGKRAVIRLTEVWDVINGGESLAWKKRFEPFISEKLAAPEAKVHASVLVRVENTVIPYLHQHIIIDKGMSSGVKVGDFFRIMERERPDHLSEELLEAQVVNAADGSATIVVLKLYKENVEMGDDAFLNLRASVR